MNDSPRKVSPLRQLMIEEMRMRQLAPKTRDAYIRAVLHFTRFEELSLAVPLVPHNAKIRAPIARGPLWLHKTPRWRPPNPSIRAHFLPATATRDRLTLMR
jgi:hypothetical protein